MHLVALLVLAALLCRAARRSAAPISASGRFGETVRRVQEQASFRFGVQPNKSDTCRTKRAPEQTVDALIPCKSLLR